MATLEELTRIALERDADQLVLVEDFPHRTALEMPLNPHIEGHDQMHAVAELGLEDSGYGPLLWAIALAHLRQARAND